MSRKILGAALCALLGAVPAAWAAGDVEAGKTKATACFACHGSDGVSINELWPNLAGQKKGYLEKQIKAFRDGTRKDPTMPIYVKNLTDQDVADISAYFNSLSGVEKPRAQMH